ncbi:unnamed protein product [Pleuronectes platessa]|uniref:Uncharacterized protein n=1 Tax=Pleuronectes platessa TaxID=8262 RepID=A0A9N7UG43_PLEPL|nr:unnamed protein product [Pleuronectes platessa]
MLAPLVAELQYMQGLKAILEPIPADKENKSWEQGVSKKEGERMLERERKREREKDGQIEREQDPAEKVDR